MKHTKSTASYIEAIQRVTDKLGYARAVDVSRELNITPGSTCTALKVLEKKWMITFDGNKFIKLTDEAKADIKRFKKNREILWGIFQGYEVSSSFIQKQVEEIYFLMNEDFMKAL